MSEITTDRVGPFILEALGKSYVCNHVNISFAVNKITTASVVIGVGKGLADLTVDQQVEELLQEVNTRQQGKGDDMFVPCDIYEVVEYSGAKTLVFRGIIVSGSVMLKTAGSALKSVKFDCMANVARLGSKPLAEYQNTCGSYLINNILGSRGYYRPVERADGYSTQNERDSQALVARFSDGLAHKDIATKVATLIDAVILTNCFAIDSIDIAEEKEKDKKSEDKLGKLVGNYFKVKDYLFCDYVLDESAILNSETDTKFNESLCEDLLDSLGSTSIFEALLQILPSTSYMLNIVPRFGGDFKMEIKPSEAWDVKDPIKVSWKMVSEINTMYQPVAHLNDPNVFVVNYSDALAMQNGTTSGEMAESTMNGVYTPDKDLQEYCLQQFNERNGKLDEAAKNAAMAAVLSKDKQYKVKIYPAPEWLNYAYLSNADLIQSSYELHTPKNENDIPERAREVNRNAAEDVACNIAKALYVHLHGFSDSATVQLLPSLRFGRSGLGTLENRLGDAMDIEDASDTAKSLNIRGILTALTFQYYSGQAGSASYTVTLSRVRPLDKDEPRISCPLYKKVNSR